MIDNLVLAIRESRPFLAVLFVGRLGRSVDLLSDDRG